MAFPITVMRRIITLIVFVAVFVTVAPAQASTMHTPALDITVQEGESIYFDWAWADDEWATSWIGFSHSPDPAPANWQNADKIHDTDGEIFLTSHTTISLAPGVWYWRLCDKSIYGEDDKCYLNSEIGKVTVIAKPPPPPSLVVLSTKTGRAIAKGALGRRFRSRFHHATNDCYNVTDTEVSCWFTWRYVGRRNHATRYRATVVVTKNQDGGIHYHYRYRTVMKTKGKKARVIVGGR